MTNNAIIGFTAETFIHSGCGQSQGAIDQPFAREQATNYPYIPGSSLKGAFRDYSRVDNFDTDEIFGKSDEAGNLLVSDLRLLLLPVRSLTSAYKWVTCPHILGRLARDLDRSKTTSNNFERLCTHAKIGTQGFDGKKLFLEELSFQGKDIDIDDKLFEVLTNLCDVIEDKDRVVIIEDDDFNWFAGNALSIQTRNKLDENKATVKGALWHEENLPPDTIMYCLLGDRNTEKQAVKDIVKKISKDKYLQTGGNETVGMGWFKMQKYGKVENE